MTGRLCSPQVSGRAAPGTHRAGPLPTRGFSSAFWIKLASLDYVWINDISWFRLFGLDCEICTVHSPSALPGPRGGKDKYILFPHQNKSEDTSSFRDNDSWFLSREKKLFLGDGAQK